MTHDTIWNVVVVFGSGVLWQLRGRDGDSDGGVSDGDDSL